MRALLSMLTHKYSYKNCEKYINLFVGAYITLSKYIYREDLCPLEENLPPKLLENYKSTTTLGRDILELYQPIWFAICSWPAVPSRS